VAKVKFWSDIDWQYPIIIALTAIIIARISSTLAPKAPTVHLKRGFALLLFVIAGFTIISNLIN
jgi:uncharacterized membrane protein YfcA